MSDLTLQVLETTLIEAISEGSTGDHRLSDQMLADMAYALHLLYKSRSDGEA
uniref:Uncharacterized protein n=1 Tax=uncultured prokaryote TaxID=198431 RepID=A0A0H5PZI0_9ZZZZ|nr:hypothetical protein [uncultured prokaryote]